MDGDPWPLFAQSGCGLTVSLRPAGQMECVEPIDEEGDAEKDGPTENQRCDWKGDYERRQTASHGSSVM